MTDSGSDNLRAITEQDRVDAIEDIWASLGEFEAELTIIDALTDHRLMSSDARNLGYYRTFVECSCGAGWWFGQHDGDPAAVDRWAIHRAQAIREALSTEVERRVAEAKAEATKLTIDDAVGWARDCSGQSADAAADYIEEMALDQALASGEEGDHA